MGTDNTNTTLETDNFERTVNTRRATFDEVAYRDGYVSGQNKAEHQRQQAEHLHAENRRLRESEGAANGFMLGATIVALAGLGVAAYFMLSPSNSPSQPSEPQSASPQVEKETRIIEKTIDRVRTVVPTTPPDVEITVPTPKQPEASQSTSSQPASAQPIETQPTTADQPPETEPVEAQPSSTNSEAMAPISAEQPPNAAATSSNPATGN